MRILMNYLSNEVSWIIYLTDEVFHLDAALPN